MTDAAPTSSAHRSRRSALGVSLTLGSVVLGLQAATQCLAHQFRYHAELGANIAGVYPPWAVILWASLWQTSSPRAIQIAAGVGTVVTVLLLGMSARVLSLVQIARNQHTHGSARWSRDQKDLKRSGLLSERSDSVYVGAIETARGLRYLRHSGPEHILTFAPTRSGKTLGPVIMTLLSWSASAFVLDLKGGEIAQMTSGWRKRYAKNKILIFEPGDSRSIGWNPLDEIDIDSASAVADAQNLAALIVDPDGKGMHTHWDKTAYALITGMILYVLHKQKRGGAHASLAAIDAELANPQRPIADLWHEMVAMHDICPAAAAAGKDMLDRPEEEGGSVLSTAKSFFSLYRDPIVARNTSRSDFSVRDLMHHESPVTLYLVTLQTDQDRMRPLVRLLVNSLVRKLTGRMDYVTQAPVRRWYWPWRREPRAARAKANYKHRLLMLLDEFPVIGKLSILQKALAYLAGFGIKVYLLVQDIPQLKSDTEGYGPNETITSNCHIQTAYPPNRIETAKYLESLTGVTTVMREQVTLSGSGLQERSRVMQEVQRPLMTADEAMRMPGPKKLGGEDGDIVEAGDMVMYVAGQPPIRGKQPLSVLDPVFQARRAVPPVTSDRLREVP